MNIVKIRMAKCNPNLNGYYYEEESYNAAVKEAIERHIVIADRYVTGTDFDLLYSVPVDNIVGNLQDIITEDGITYALIKTIRDVNPDNYCIGYAMMVPLQWIDGRFDPAQGVPITRIMYAALLPRQD